MRWNDSEMPCIEDLEVTNVSPITLPYGRAGFVN